MKPIDSRRQRRIDKKSEELKLLRLWTRKQNLLRSKRNYNWVKLDKPIRRGYRRFYVLREDIARSREAHVYRQILPHINSEARCSDKTFTHKPWNSKVKKEIGQGLNAVSHKDWIKKVEPNLTIKQKSMFDKRWHEFRDSKNKITGGEWRFYFNKPYVFILKIEPYYVTHQVIINPQLESEMRELHNRIKSQGLMPKISKIMGWKNDLEWVDRRQLLIQRGVEKLTKEEVAGQDAYYGYYYDDIYD